MKRSLWVMLIGVLIPVVAFAAGDQEEAGADTYEPQELASSLTLDEMQEYRSHSSYNEAPALAELVEAGELPPVAERLPAEPLTIKATMFDGVGDYGGVWRAAWGATPEGWNVAAGLAQGYFGIEQILGESLVETGPMWELEVPEPVPNVAKSWEWSEDGFTLTMQLVEGIKWSDGVELTADDVLFTYNDNILDPQVTSWKTASAWTFGGKVTELEKVDDYTIRWHFGVAFPYRVFFLMDYHDFDVAPAHVYKQYHPKYNDSMDYEDYTNVAPPDAVPPVVIGPWVPVIYRSEQIMIMVRNPYYWQVDVEGNQLPYLDEVWYVFKGSDTGRTTAFLAGDVDMTNSANPKMFSMLLEEEQKPTAPFRLNWDEPHVGYRVVFNQSLSAGITSERDQALREIMRDVRFRKMVSHVIDREGLTRALFPGPQLMPWYGAYTSGALFYQSEDVNKFAYNLDTAKELLSEMGFEDTNGDGFVNWPEGTLAAGKELVVPLALGDDPQQVQIGELLVPMFRDVGIDLRLDIMQGTILGAKTNAGEWQLLLNRTTGVAAPDLHPEEIGPISQQTPIWHIAGEEGRRELQGFEQEIFALLEEAATTASAAERAGIFQEIGRISTANVYTAPIYQYQAAYGIAKRFRNVPGDLPARLYQWNWTNLQPQQVWAPSELQMESQYQDRIPTAAVYEARAQILSDTASE